MAGQEGQPLRSHQSRLRFVPWLSVAGYLSLAVAMGAEAASYSGGFSCGALGFASSCPAWVRSWMEFVILWIAAAATVGILIRTAASPDRARRIRIPSQAVAVWGCVLLVFLLLVIGPIADLIRAPAISMAFYYLYQLEALFLLALAFLDPLFEKARVGEPAFTMAIMNGIIAMFSVAAHVAITFSPGVHG